MCLGGISARHDQQIGEAHSSNSEEFFCMSNGTSCSRLDGVLSPKSIAVVGASTRLGTAGNDIFRNLLFSGFNGPVYPINPKASHVMGVAAYARLSDVPGPVDMAVLIVPAAAVLGVIDEAIAKKVHGLVVISAGFKEVGHEGAVLENKVCEKVRAAGIPLIGPNCLGVINTHADVRMNATFGRKMPAAGNLGFLSQSGALAPRCWITPKNATWASASSSVSATRPTSTRSTCWTTWPRTKTRR